MLYNVFAISVGAVFGALSRYGIFLCFENRHLGFPYHTLIVNLLGCFAIGVLFQIFSTKSDVSAILKLFLITGFLGSFTTFSSFVADGGVLLKQEEIFKTFLYVSFSVFGGFICFFIAIYLVNFFLKHL